MGFGWVEILLAIIIIWLAVISYYLSRSVKHYHVLTKGVNKKSMDIVLENIVREVSLAKRNISQLNLRCDTIEKNETFHIQKIGLLRFNPFKDTGGDQSFILTLRDANETGVVITGLHSRSGLRWYVKKVVNGKSMEHELSEEEQKALKLV